MKENPLTIEINGQTYFTRYGASKQLSVSPCTITREVSRRNIKCFKHPKYDLFKPEWLEEWIMNKTQKPCKRN